MKNAGRAGIVPKDDFDINIKYKRLDAVMYDKSLYIAKKDVPLGTLPTDTTYWMKSICGNKEPIATTETAGIVKPDGITITVDVDGTLHGNSEVTVDSELSKESENPLQNKTVAEELEKKLNSDGDSKDLTTTFTSQDSTNVTQWTDVGVLQSGEKHSSLFQKIATMFKNIRYLYHMLGTADISTLGEGANIGTVTGALSKLNSDIYNRLSNTNFIYTGNATMLPTSISEPNVYDLPSGFTKDNAFVAGIRIVRNTGHIYSNDGLMCNVLINSNNLLEVNATEDGIKYCSGAPIGILLCRISQ